MNRLDRIKLVQVGLGPIGIAAVAEAMRRRNLDLLGGIDVDPALEGKDVGVLVGGEPSGRVVRSDLPSALAEWKPQAAVLTTVSQVERLASTVETLVSRGVNVVSSSEELLVAARRAPEAAARLDRLAKETGVSVVAAGVNPGFMMDLLPVFLTAMCRRVEKVQVWRCQDAGKRRVSLQRKVGAGLSAEAFRAGEAEGWIGHKGLQESLALLCEGLGWQPERLEETLEPILADIPLKTKFAQIAPGDVAGVHHIGRAWKGTRLLAELDLRMYVGAERSYDRVCIEGDPPIDVTVEGGIPGDGATVAALLNAVPLVVHATPGLLSPLSLPIPRGMGV